MYGAAHRRCLRWLRLPTRWNTGGNPVKAPLLPFSLGQTGKISRGQKVTVPAILYQGSLSDLLMHAVCACFSVHVGILRICFSKCVITLKWVGMPMKDVAVSTFAIHLTVSVSSVPFYFLLTAHSVLSAYRPMEVQRAVFLDWVVCFSSHGRGQ